MLNADDPLVRADGRANVGPGGPRRRRPETPTCAPRTYVCCAGRHASFMLVTPEGTRAGRPAATWVRTRWRNALAAAAVARALGMAVADVAAALSLAQPAEPVADGGRRARGRRHRRQRRLQRQPRVGAGRPGGARGARRGPPYLGGAGRDARARRGPRRAARGGGPARGAPRGRPTRRGR